MIIQKLNLLAYGHFSKVELNFPVRPNQFHLVYGPNESGKSTCLRAINALLFGIPTRTDDSFLHPNAKLRIGATLLDTDGNTVSFVRRKNGKSKLYDQEDVNPIDSSILDKMLGGVDQEAFNHRFGLSHQQLVDGGKAIHESDGDLGEILFAAGAGVSQLSQIRSTLEERTQKIFLERGKKSLNLLLKELEDKRKELRDIQTPPAEYQALKLAVADAEREAIELSQQLDAANQSLAQYKSYCEALQVIPIWRRDSQRLEQLQNTPLLDDDFIARRRESTANRTTYSRLVQGLTKEKHDLEQQIQNCNVDQAVLQHETEIIELFQSISVRQSAEKDKENLDRVACDLNRHLRELLRDLGLQIAPDCDQEHLDDQIAKLHISDAAHVRIAKLAALYEMVRQQEHDALESLETLRKQISELEDELEHAPLPGDPACIESILNEIGSASTLVDAVETEWSQIKQLESECSGLIRELRLGKMTPSEAVALVVPSPGQIEDLSQQIASCQSRREGVAQRLHSLRSEHQSLTEQFHRNQRDLELPTDEALQQVRDRRDHCVEALNEPKCDDSSRIKIASSLRQHVREADEVVDTMRQHHQQINERSTMSDRLSEIELSIKDTEVELQSIDHEAAEAQDRWQKIWAKANVDAGTAREMRDWQSTHQMLCQKVSRLGENQSRHQTATNRVHRAQKRMVSAITTAIHSLPVQANANRLDSELFTDDSFVEMDLESLCDHANAVREELATASESHHQCIRKRNELTNELPRVEARYETCVSRRKQWESDWQQAIQTFSSFEDSSPSVINTRIKKIGELFNEKRERDLVLGRIATIEDDARSFSARVHSLAKLLGEKKSDSEQPVADDAALSNQLFKRLEESKESQKRLTQLNAEFERKSQQLSENEAMLATAESQLSELCREAEVQTPDQLPTIETESKEKRKILDSYERCVEKLTLIATGRSIDDLVDSAEQHHEEELHAKIAECQRMIDELNQNRSAVLERVGGLKSEFSAIDGGQRAADLHQEMQLLTARIERESTRYAKLKVASMLLSRAIDHYRSENESPVLQLACEHFRELTCQRYIGLKADFDDKGRSKLFGIKPIADGEESLVGVDAMSLGTADSLFLALRLASLEHQLASGPAIPVVIDDCLIQLDDERTIAALKRLSQLSKRTQVILFTHHRHLLDLANATLTDDQYHAPSDLYAGAN